MFIRSQNAGCCRRWKGVFLLLLSTLSQSSVVAFAACSTRAWHHRRGVRASAAQFHHMTFRGEAGVSTVVGEGTGGKMDGSSIISPRCGEAKLRDVELWLDEIGVDRRSGGSRPPAAKLKSFSGKGIGLEAAVELERDSTVASIPRRVCLSSDPSDAPTGTLRAWSHALMAASFPNSSTATAHTEGANALETDVAVVTLQLFVERAAGTRSKFAPWMAMLNREGDMNVPALWPADELETLKGTLVLQDVETCLERAKVERDVVAAAMAKAFRGEIDPGGEFPEWHWLNANNMEGRPTHAEWLHARCTVQSRAYRLGSRYILIPLVDFANHDDDINFAVCPGDGIFTGSDEVAFLADRSYRPGQEVCTSYGDMDNAKRLFSFGFVTLSQEAQRSSLSPADWIPLPTEAFCDVALKIAPADSFRTFKERVLHKLGPETEGGLQSLDLSVVWPLSSCCLFVSQLVEGSARPFVDSIMPVLRLIALSSQDFAEESPLGDLRILNDGVDDVFRGDVADRQANDSSYLLDGLEEHVLERLQSRCSSRNEREALRLLAEQCSEKLQAIGLTSGDVEALRKGARESNEVTRFAATEPRSLLCSAVRVGEAMAWYALQEACNNGIEGSVSAPFEGTWSSWVSRRCRSTRVK